MLFPAPTPSRSDFEAERSLQRLAGAVLIQALQDAGSGPRRHREEALEWIQGKTTGGFSFDFCCALLGRSPDDVRQRLMKKNFIPRPEIESDYRSYGGAAYTRDDFNWGARAS